MPVSEENFIREIKRGNEEALYYLIDNYGWIIKSVISKHLFYMEGYQEECFNDCLYAVWENIESFDEARSSFGNWLGGIARYKSIDYLRKYLRLRDEKNIDDVNLYSEDNVVESLLRKEFNDEINYILSLLSERDKILFKRFYLKEESIKEIAEDTKIKEGTLYSRISRGREKIRNSLKGGRGNE